MLPHKIIDLNHSKTYNKCPNPKTQNSPETNYAFPCHPKTAVSCQLKIKGLPANSIKKIKSHPHPSKTIWESRNGKLANYWAEEPVEVYTRPSTPRLESSQLSRKSFSKMKTFKAQEINLKSYQKSITQTSSITLKTTRCKMKHGYSCNYCPQHYTNFIKASVFHPTKITLFLQNKWSKDFSTCIKKKYCTKTSSARISCLTPNVQLSYPILDVPKGSKRPFRW